MTTKALRPYPLELWRDDNPMCVIVHASARRISGEPGSLSIQAGWEIDIARVTFRNNTIETTPDEREELQAQILKIVAG